MNKRDFLKGSSAMLAGGLLAREMAWAETTATPRSNWAGNYTFHALKVDQPTNAQEVAQLLNGLQRAKAVGQRHSFNGIADSHGDQISLKGLDEMTLNREAHTVTVGAGITYGKLAPWLDKQGFAVHNLASLPHVSVVGACATGTHGSGLHNGNLSTAVSGVELVDGSGNVHLLTRAGNPDVFPGVALGLGALGVITRVTLDVVPTFQVAQIVYENLSFDQLDKNLDTIFGSGYSVSLFTDWQGHRATQVWLKKKLASNTPPPMPPLFYGATLQKTKLHPLAGKSAVNCTEQQGIPGPWYERLPHFRMDFTPSSGQEIQSEFFVDRKDAFKAILAVEQLRDRITPHLFISELRTIAADELWMSMAYRRDAMALHFTWKPEADAVNTVLPAIEAALAPFNARPHWAKVYTMDASRVQPLYPRFADFQKLTQRLDPQGRFRNDYLQRNLALA